MGLSKGRPWLPTACVSALILLLGMLGDSARELLAWSRAAVAEGEAWRLLSSHFVHLGWSHLVLNVVGLWLVWYLVVDAWRTLEWLLITLVIVAVINLGFWLLEPRLAWYVGLSGVLHGLLTAGAVRDIHERRVEGILLAVVLAAKIIYEQAVGPLPGSEASTGGPVIVAAHLYGVVGGLLAAVPLLIRVRTGASI